VRRVLIAGVAALAALSVIAVDVASQGQGQGQGPPTVDDLECAPAKRSGVLRGEQSAVLAQLGRLTELRDRKDLELLANMGFSFRPNQFTSVKGIGVSVSNPVPLLQQGSPNVLFYTPGGDAADVSDPQDPDFPYTLVGWGYEVPYAPFHFPGFLQCVGAGDWHVHERGVDALASGRTTTMAPSETIIGGAIGALYDPPALQTVPGYPHPRAWSAHLWLDPSGVPRSEILDPTDPSPGVDADVGSNLYFLEEPPTGVLDPTATGFPLAFEPGEGQRAKGGGGTYALKSTGFQRGGTLNVVEAELPDGSRRADSGPLGHDEGWYVLEGQISFKADGQSLPAREGSFVYLPAGADYSFEVEGGTARAVYATATSGQERSAELKPYVLEPGEGEELTVGESPYVMKATGKDTGGAFVFMEVNLKEGTTPPPHIHHLEVEVFYVIDGEVTFLAGGQTVPARSGSLIQLPVGLPHVYGVQGDGTAKALLIALPAGLENLFRLLDKLGSKPPTAAQALKTGVEPVVPPAP
jgi:quercetin dioxygenase-like cupin family protein